jgi:hypothetical protein
MMIDIFSQTNELLLFGLPVPLNYAPIFWARVDVLVRDFKGCDAKCMPFIFYRFSETISGILLVALLVKFVLLSQLI